MTIVSRRIVPFTALIAVAVMLSVWVTANAAGGAEKTTPAPMTFTVIPTHEHDNITGNGGLGQTAQQTFKMVKSGSKIGHGTTVETITPNHSVFQNIEARFTRRGRVELQGALILLLDT